MADDWALNLTDVAKSLWRVHDLVMLGDIDAWDNLSVTAWDAWERVARKGQDLIETSDGMKWLDLAKRLCGIYRGGDSPFRDLPASAFSALPLKERLAWEAVGRHLANLMSLDEPADLIELESRWRLWVEEKLKLLENQHVQNA